MAHFTRQSSTASTKATTRETRILDITVLPEYRNRGIGTSLLRDLLDEASHPGKRVRIHVETFNPSLRLLERLGFKSIAEEGINFLMEWRPAP
jgi:ribosomal protein S18 acetylase RimI-like enzyme